MGLINIYKKLMRGVNKTDSSDCCLPTGDQAKGTRNSQFHLKIRKLLFFIVRVV